MAARNASGAGRQEAEAGRRQRVLGPLAALAVTLATVFAMGGCGSSDGGIGDWVKTSAPAVLVQIGGQVWLPLGAASLQAGVRGQATTGVAAPAATVYLEERPDLTAATDQDGRFLIARVPAGSYHVIAELTKGSIIYKQRSDLVTLTGEVGTFQMGSPVLLAVANRRTGLVVRNRVDATGLPGVNLTLWGRPYTTGTEGEVELGPLPEGVWPVALAAVGYKPRSILLGFTPRRQQLTEVALTPLTAADTNQAPVVEVERSFTILRTNETGGLAAIGLDPEGDAVTYAWEVTGGTLSSAKGPTTIFTAPSTPGTCRVTVVGKDANGGTGRCVMDFQVTEGGSLPNPGNRLPLAASRPYPADGAENQGSSVVLTWAAEDPDGDPLTYEVRFASSGSSLATIASFAMKPAWEVTGLAPYTTYFWQVVCRDPYGGVSQNNPTWRFSTGDGTNRPPNPPLYPLPSDLAVNQLPNLRLAWTGGDPDPGDALSYEIWLGTTSERLALATTTTAAAGVLTGLESGRRYYWRVVARDGRGGVAAGDVWRFDTFGTPNRAPDAPQPASPADGATGIDLSPRLAWTATDPDGDPLLFDVYLGKAAPLAQVGKDLVSPNVAVSGLAPNTTYYWQVVVRDGKGAVNPQPAVWSFRTRTPANGAPVFAGAPSPADGATQVATQPLLAWTVTDPDGDPLTFDLLLDPASPPVMVAVRGVPNAWWSLPVGLAAGQVYQWQVVAHDGRGGDTLSPVWRFTTATTLDDKAPTLVSVQPASGATGVALNRSIDLVFSEPMKRATVEDGQSVTASPPVGFTYVWDSPSEVRIFPDAFWATGSYHVISLAANRMRDLADNLLTTGRTFGFTAVADLPVPSGLRSAGFALAAAAGETLAVSVPALPWGKTVRVAVVGEDATATLTIVGDRAAPAPVAALAAARSSAPEAAFREIESRLPLPVLPLRAAVAVAAPEVGSLRTFFVPAFEGLATTTAYPLNKVEAVCWGATDRTLVYVDRRVPLRDFTTITEMRGWLEEVVRPRLGDYLGTEPPLGPDNDARLTILLTDALHPQMFGLFNAADLFLVNPGDPALRESNQRKMLYVRFTADAGSQKGAVAHEYAHLVQYWEKRARAAAGVVEETWLSEGIAQLAEEICGYGPAQGNQRLAAAVRLSLQGLRNLSVTSWSGAPSYGLSYLFARFLAEGGRYATTTREATRQLVQTAAVGRTNVATLAKEPFGLVLGRFAVSLLLNRWNTSGAVEYGLRGLDLAGTYGEVTWPGVPVDEAAAAPGTDATVPAGGMGFFRRVSTGGTVELQITNLTAPVRAWFVDERR
ncbi:MAG: hypothetical protein GX442_19245 [Candidatus Riflebacteria bacterium]|nr:hypothetical protein [Candidatus Riflebacteria bacterium]